MGVIGVAMLGVAVLSFYWQHYAKLGLLEFALQVMVFAYAGLLGVYFAAVLTPRGNSASVIASLIAGFVTVLLLQPGIAATIGLPAALCHLAFPFQLCIGTAIAFLIAIAPRGGRNPEDPAEAAVAG
jgi:Na+/proline symporter